MRLLLLCVVLVVGCKSKPQPTEPEPTPPPAPKKCCEQKEVVNGCVKVGDGMWQRLKCECVGCNGCDGGKCLCDPDTCGTGCKSWCVGK